MKTETKILLILTAIFGLLLFYGCNSHKVDGKITITEDEFNTEVEKTMASMTQQGIEITDLEELKQDVIRQMVETEILNRIIAADKFSITEDVLDSEIEAVKANFGSDENFESALEAEGFTPESFRDEYRKTIIQKQYYEQVMVTAEKVSEKEIKDFYDANPQYFTSEESVTASHILVLADDTFTDAQKKEARKKINDILVKAKRGDDFAELAKEYSEGPSAPNGGYLGEFYRGQMVPEFEDAAFALEPGEISDVVETQFGYHIIKLSEKNAPAVQPLDETISGQISEYLKRVKAQDELAVKIENAHDDYELDVPIEFSWD